MTCDWIEVPLPDTGVLRWEKVLLDASKEAHIQMLHRVHADVDN